MKKIILSIAMLTSIAFISCSSDDDSSLCGNVSDDEAAQIGVNLFGAAFTHGVNPTPESCIDYKSAIEAYITYGNNIKDCLNSEEKAELEAEIVEFETQLANLDCA